MIPKLYVKENGYIPTFGPTILNGMSTATVIPTAFIPGPMFVTDGIATAAAANNAGGDVDSLLQHHRRKMLRRAANRRSAQLSRARKKAFMEDLKNENNILQKMVDILDSQPDLVFCVTNEGHITFVSDRAKHFIKAEEMVDDDPSHMNQFLTPESMEVFLDAINQVKQSYLYSSSGAQDGSSVSAVREVCFQDANGFTSVGYLRVSRVMRKPSRDDYNENENDSDNGDEVITRPPPKKTKKGSDSSSDFNEHTTFNEHHYKLKRESDPTMVGAMALQSLHKSNSSDEGGEHRSSTYSESAAPSKSVTTSKSSGKCTHGSTGSDANTSEDSNKPRAISEEDESEVEYVCVIRPADVSVPSGSSVCFQTYLSTASMVEHDRKGEDTTASGNAQNPRGSPSCSVSSSNDSGSNHSGSDDKQSDNKVSITTGTSSETGSDEGYSA